MAFTVIKRVVVPPDSCALSGIVLVGASYDSRQGSEAFLGHEREVWEHPMTAAKALRCF